MVFFKKKKIILGEQAVTELTVFEYKRLFSIKLFNFHKSEGVQDRFHTHAFDAVSLLLWGNYVEEVILDGKIVQLPRDRKRALFIPKNTYHRITRSLGCVTLLITGPWGKEFKELRHVSNNTYQEVTCGEHRKEVSFGKTTELRSK